MAWGIALAPPMGRTSERMFARGLMALGKREVSAVILRAMR